MPLQPIAKGQFDGLEILFLRFDTFETVWHFEDLEGIPNFATAKKKMETTTVKSICDFTFGMLFMLQIIGTVAMYMKGWRHRLQRMTFWIMLYLTCISLFEAAYFFFFPGTPGSLTSHLTDILEMTVIPCAFINMVRLTQPRRKLLGIILCNATLYALLMASYCILEREIIYQSALGFSVFYSLFIIFYGWISAKRMNKELVDNFSDEQLSLYWLKYIIYLYIAILLIWTLATVYATEWMVAAYNVFMLLFLSLWCYFVFRQEDMLEALAQMSEEEARGQEVIGKGYAFEGNLTKAFEEDAVYLNPRLNIAGLAITVGTNRSYLSAYLNQHQHTTFYEYVNQWRVRRAKELLAESAIPLEQIAGKSGFNSLSSFRRYFTKAVGMTPSAYRKARALPARAKRACPKDERHREPGCGACSQ